MLILLDLFTLKIIRNVRCGAPLSLQLLKKYSMKVFKFGGASVSSVERIQKVAEIIKDYGKKDLIIIISAMGKTTNALEKVAEAFYAGKTSEALSLFDVVKQNHLTTAKYLLVTSYNATLNLLTDFFTEVEWLLHDKPVRTSTTTTTR